MQFVPQVVPRVEEPAGHEVQVDRPEVLATEFTGQQVQAEEPAVAAMVPGLQTLHGGSPDEPEYPALHVQFDEQVAPWVEDEAGQAVQTDDPDALA